MKKLILAAVTVVALSVPALADQNTENALQMDEQRRHFYAMTDEMIEGELQMVKMRQAMLTNYQRLLKQMMEAEVNFGQRK